jgi:hypothetical protein
MKPYICDIYHSLYKIYILLKYIMYTKHNYFKHDYIFRGIGTLNIEKFDSFITKVIKERILIE